MSCKPYNAWIADLALETRPEESQNSEAQVSIKEEKNV